MNPFGVTGQPTYPTTLIAAWNIEVQQSIDEYWTHPFANCPHGGNCTRRFRRWGVR